MPTISRTVVAVSVCVERTDAISAMNYELFLERCCFISARKVTISCMIILASCWWAASISALSSWTRVFSLGCCGEDERSGWRVMVALPLAMSDCLSDGLAKLCAAGLVDFLWVLLAVTHTQVVLQYRERELCHQKVMSAMHFLL